jgi:hypothetical protein
MTDKLNEPKWKNDLVKVIWEYARKTGQVYDGRLEPGLGELIANIRDRCDRCGRSRIFLLNQSRGQESVDPYQCCWVHSETEDYCPHLCLACHEEFQKLRPHETISV